MMWKSIVVLCIGVLLGGTVRADSPDPTTVIRNGSDQLIKVINEGKTYFDKGISFTMPLDFFYTHCARGTWGYGMSAWLRDVGAYSYTGQELYYLLNDYR